MATNIEVAHAWANQVKQSAKTSNGNFSFRDKSLYSYSTEIARFIDGRIVATARSYSPTTEGKHKNAMKQACSHLPLYYIEEEMRDVQPDANFQSVAPLILDRFEKELVDEIYTARNSKSFSWNCERIRSLAQSIIHLETRAGVVSELPASQLLHQTEHILATVYKTRRV